MAWSEKILNTHAMNIRLLLFNSFSSNSGVKSVASLLIMISLSDVATFPSLIFVLSNKQWCYLGKATWAVLTFSYKRARLKKQDYTKAYHLAETLCFLSSTETSFVSLVSVKSATAALSPRGFLLSLSALPQHFSVTTVYCCPWKARILNPYFQLQARMHTLKYFSLPLHCHQTKGLISLKKQKRNTIHADKIRVITLFLSVWVTATNALSRDKVLPLRQRDTKTPTWCPGRTFHY